MDESLLVPLYKSPQRISEIGSRVLWVLVIGALPAVGLVAGPSYAALIFGLGGVQFVYTAVLYRRVPQPDPALVFFAAAFAAWCCIGAIWSISPARTVHGAVQLTAIFIGSLVFLSNRFPSDDVSDWAFRILPLGLAVGVLILVVDTLSGYKFQLLLGHGIRSDTKYNRGLDYCALIVWPMLAYAARHRRLWTAFAICGLLVTGISVGETSSAPAEAAAGVATFVLAIIFRDRAVFIIGSALSAMALTLPYLMQIFAPYRPIVAPYIKPSGLHRLEIWDFMLFRALARPFLGWGLLGSYSLHPTAEEFSRYVYGLADGNGIYPHNQWVEGWVETGLVGIVVMLGFSLFILSRIHRCLPRDVRPFAYAAFASCVTLSLLNFEIPTDSMWAVFAATAFLFRALGSVEQASKL